MRAVWVYAVNCTFKGVGHNHTLYAGFLDSTQQEVALTLNADLTQSYIK